MSIYGIGAYFDGIDVSQDFINDRRVRIGWDDGAAPELHQFMKSLKVGDIVYLKLFPPGSSEITIKAIGIIFDNEIDEIIVENRSNRLISRNVRWLITDEFRISTPHEKNNVRRNTMYEEFHRDVQREIISRIIQQMNPQRG